MLIVNEGDYGLPDIAGRAVTFTHNQNLPTDLYVFGTANHRDFSVYLDPQLQQARRICEHIAANTEERCVVDMPFNPRQRPALGLARSLRENTELATRIAVFTLFAINGRIRFGNRELHYRPGDMVIVQGETCVISEVDETNGVIWCVVRNDRVARFQLADARPIHPYAAGQRVRVLFDGPFANGGRAAITNLNHDSRGTVLAPGNGNNGGVIVQFDGGTYNMDVDQVIRTN